MSHNPVVHFEMPYDDAKRVQKFYQDVFGWGMNLMAGEEMGNYITAQTAKTDENRMITEKGAINGGFFMRFPEPGGQVPSVVVAVEDLKESMRNVEEAGGKIMNDPVDIPGVGRYVAIQDSEGNRVSMLQAKR